MNEDEVDIAELGSVPGVVSSDGMAGGAETRLVVLYSGAQGKIYQDRFRIDFPEERQEGEMCAAKAEVDYPSWMSEREEATLIHGSF